MKTTQVAFFVNGMRYQLSVGKMFGQIPPNELLIDTLRSRFGLTGTKIACKDGACGCCTVLIDGAAVPACEVLTLDCEGKHITTIEGLAGEGGTLHPVQQAFVDHAAFQCGFCTPGIIMTTVALLEEQGSRVWFTGSFRLPGRAAERWTSVKFTIEEDGTILPPKQGG